MSNPPALFIFRRDLRLEDNTGLISALATSKSVAACFIFDPKQGKGDYFSPNAFQFMLASLAELSASLEKKGAHLHLFTGAPHEIVAKLASTGKISSVHFNRDYTPFSLARDSAIAQACKKHSTPLSQYNDTLLCEPELVAKADGKPYTIFSHYFRAASKFPVAKPAKNTHTNYFKGTLPGENSKLLLSLRSKITPNSSLAQKAGRKAGLAILEGMENFRHYGTLRNLPAHNATTHLSAHHKFGTISIRETHHAITETLGSSHPLMNEINWRDFFTYIAFHFPHVFGSPFNKKYAHLNWGKGSRKLAAWKEGKTGFPIVDAGMRQLAATGFMHNRVRMIVASFLTKDLHIDWREGEKHFAQLLVDYDPCVNNGNWQWSASTGCDAQPYFRIFNPWLQQKRFDPECAYIKKWVPKLAHLSAREIHALETTAPPAGYPQQIAEHSHEAAIAKAMFRGK